MRKVLSFFILLGIAQFGCNKPNGALRPANIPLDGTWRMILATDIASGVSETKPADIPNDVEITFTSVTASNGTFTGVTPTNQVWENNYFTGTGETLSIPELGITKAWETSWGFLFVGNIRYSLSYTIENGNILKITTAEKILTFQKLP